MDKFKEKETMKNRVLAKTLDKIGKVTTFLST